MIGGREESDREGRSVIGVLDSTSCDENDKEGT